MNSILYQFEIEIDELRKHLDYVKNISAEINSLSPLFSYVNSLTKKKFNYNSLIISLYGIVENYSEKFIVSYLENMSSVISEYPNLKESIRNKNIYNSASLTLKVIDKKFLKYNHLKEIDLITNLNSCLTNLPNYSLNYESFTMLSGNMKHSKMCDLFKQIDLDLNAAFIKHTEFNLSRSENQFKKLDELVDMRNEVAHGNVNTLLNPNQIEEYVDFIEKYLKNLHKILVIDLEQEKLKYWKKHHSILLENISIFGGNIIGFNNKKNILINNSSIIIIEKNNSSLRIATIEKIITFPNGDITVKLNTDSNIKDTQQFYIKSEIHLSDAISPTLSSSSNKINTRKIFKNLLVNRKRRQKK